MRPRWQILRSSWIAFLLCLGLLGAYLDGAPDDPLRLHGRTRSSRAVRLGDDLHVAAHAEPDPLSHFRQPDRFDAALTAFISLPERSIAHYVALVAPLAGIPEVVSARPLGRGPPSLQ